MAIGVDELMMMKDMASINVFAEEIGRELRYLCYC